MIYASEKKQYLVLATVFTNETNDCYIAKEQDDESGIKYVLVAVKDHDRVKQILEVQKRFDDENGGKSFEGSPFLDAFSTDSSYVMVFAYKAARPVEDFFSGDACTLELCEEICTNVILACITSALPWPVLYLAITQHRINISRENTVYLTYDLDFSGLDPTKDERECASECAKLLLWILSEKRDQKNISYELLSKRSKNRSYSRFTELYRDIQIASTPGKKRKITTRIRSFFYRNADQLFGILFWVCLILGVVALIMFITHFAVGDIPFLRIFFNSFKQIGTENLGK